MIRIIKTLALSLMLLSVTVKAEESSVIHQITTQAEDTIGAIFNKLSTPLISYKDIQCLARNIYYESANEPEEGKVAVGLVTLNRANDPKYPNTVCGVVQQKTVITVPVQEKIVRKEFLETKVETKTTWVQKVVCQFSWNCVQVKKPKEDDPRWQESLRVANQLAVGGYPEWQAKYANSFHFHATHINPGWKLKRIGRVGGHVFYH